MTLPMGAAGINPAAVDGVTGDDGSIPGQAGNDQSSVIEMLKARHIANSPGWTGSATEVYAGQGITGTLGLSAGTIKAFLQKLVGTPLGVTSGGLPDILQLFTGIPASQVVASPTQNLLLNPQYTFGLLSWTGSGLFDWVSDFGQGNTLPGSAKVVANGTLKNLLSEWIWVQEGDTVDVAGWHMRTGGTATGTPIEIRLRALDLFGGVVSTTVIGSAAGSGSAAWAQITGTEVTVPSGAVWVQAELVVDTTMTAGTVWFDDIELIKNGTLTAGVIPNITPGSGPGQSQALQDSIDAAYGGLTSSTATGNPVEALTALFQQLNAAVTAAVNSSANAFNLMFQFGGIIHQANDSLPDTPTYVDADDFLEQSGAAATAMVNNVFTTWVDLYNAMTGLSHTSSTSAATADQLAALTATTVANSATIAALQSDNDATNNNGMSGGDDFERTSSTDLGAGWSIVYTVAGPVLATPNGHDASLILSGTVASTAKASRVLPADQETLTDYQKMSATIGSSIGGYPTFGQTYSSISLVGRKNAAGTKYVRFEVNADQVRLYYANGGAETMLGSPAVLGNLFTAGANFVMECGVGATLNIYRLRRNNAIIFSYVDTGLVTNIGPLYRGWASWLEQGAGPVAPPILTGVTVADNFPSTVAGSTLSAYRASTSGVSVSSGTIPNGFFDTLDRASTDIVWNATTGEATVSVEHTYLISISVWDTASHGGGTHTEGAVYVNGTLARQKVTADTLTGFADSPPHSLDITVPIYLHAGDVVRAGIQTNAGARTCVGDVDGTLSWFTITRLG